MKKLIPIIAFIFSASALKAQSNVAVDAAKFTVGSFKNGSMPIAQLAGSVSEKDTVYTLAFTNFKEKTSIVTKTISFNEEGGTLDSLYSLLTTFFAKENIKNKEYNKSFNLGKYAVKCSNYRLMGTTGFNT